MFRLPNILLVSALWRPHSEQLMQWIANSNGDPTTLSLARDYVNNLDFSSALHSFEDGLELANILPRIKYPLATHAIRRLSAHFDARSGDIGTDELRQLAANIALSPQHIEYYEATLNSPAVMSGLRQCLHNTDDLELAEFAHDLCEETHMVQNRGSSLSSMVTILVAEELQRRLTDAPDRAAFLHFLVDEGVPIERDEMSVFQEFVCKVTTELKQENLFSLLQKFAMQRNIKRFAKWGSSVQIALIREKAIGRHNIVTILEQLMLAGSVIDDSLCSLVTEVADTLIADDAVRIFTVWQDVSTQTEVSSPTALKVLGIFHDRARTWLRAHQNDACQGNLLRWLLCLSCFCPSDAASLLQKMLSKKTAMHFSSREAAILCSVMINTRLYPPQLLSAVAQNVNSKELDQAASIHVMYVLQLNGTNTPSDMVRNAVGRAATRLVASRGQKGKPNDDLSERDWSLLVAGLSFIDGEEQMTVLQRVLRARELSLSAARFLLQHITQHSTHASRVVIKTALSRITRSPSECHAVELSLVLSLLAELGLRDVVAFKGVLRELKRKSPTATDIITAARAARSLKLPLLIEQSELIDDLREDASISLMDLLTLVSCCGVEKRQTLLSQSKVMKVTNQITIAERTTSDLILLLILLPPNDSRRTELAAILKTREPVERGVFLIEDVVSAFESAISNEEVEGLCHTLSRALSDLQEAHLMRLLRCAERYENVPVAFFRVVGKPLSQSAAAAKLSPSNAVSWLSFYVDRNIRDVSVGRRLLTQATSVRGVACGSNDKTIQRAARLYGVEVKRQGRAKSKIDKIHDDL